MQDHELAQRLARLGFILGLAAGTAMAVAIAIFILALSTTSLRAHDWYPAECCSGHDCYPIDPTELRLTAAGWYVIRTGETIGFGSPKERQSLDGGFHRCSMDGDPEARTICLFVPGFGS